MKKFVSIEIGCRGLIDDVSMVDIKYDVRDYMDIMLGNRELDMMQDCENDGDDWDEDWKDYFEEFCMVVEGKKDEVYGVFLGEEESVMFISVENEDYKELEKRWKEVGWRGELRDLSNSMVNDLIAMLMIKYGV